MAAFTHGDEGVRDLPPEGVRAAGSLQLGEPRDLLALEGVPGAYDADGNLDPGTLRRWGRGDGEGPDRVPISISGQDVVETHDEAVVWGGAVAGHYGHFLTESVARLWPILPGSELEGTPVVFASSRMPPFASEWLEGFGVRVVALSARGAVRFRKMFVPEPACRLNAWIAPELRDLHVHARRGMSVALGRPRSGVLWQSRSGLDRSRAPYDECLLEWVLGDHVSIVRPETMTLAEQVEAIEGARAVSGVLGSAFHTTLMAVEIPQVVALCPSWVPSTFVAQNELLGAAGAFVHSLATVTASTSGQERFPGSHRLLVPETLRALGESVLPALRDDPLAASLAFPERLWLNGEGACGSRIEPCLAKVLLDPLSVRARMALGAAFEAGGEGHCALEQYLMVADLTADYVYAPLRAARLLSRMRRSEEALELAKRALAIDPGSEEALRYVTA